MVHEGRIESVEIEWSAGDVGGNGSGFLENASGRRIVPKTAAAGLGLGEFKIAGWSIFQYPTSVHGGASVQNGVEPVEASFFGDGFQGACNARVASVLGEASVAD